MIIKNKIFLSILFILLILGTINCVSSEEAPPMPQIENNVVSGGVDLANANPWNTSGELEYEIPN